MAGSTSLEGYDIYLRTDLGMAGGIYKKPAEWHLRVPRAFVSSEFGEIGVLGTAKKSPTPFYAVMLAAVKDSTNNSMIPMKSIHVRWQVSDILVTLENVNAGRIDYYGFGPDVCVTADNWYKYPNCSDVNVLCEIEFSFRGWRAQVAVDPTIYKSSQSRVQRSCDEMREILARYTVSVDDITKERDQSD